MPSQIGLISGDHARPGCGSSSWGSCGSQLGAGRPAAPPPGGPVQVVRLAAGRGERTRRRTKHRPQLPREKRRHGAALSPDATAAERSWPVKVSRRSPRSLASSGEFLPPPNFASGWGASRYAGNTARTRRPSGGVQVQALAAESLPSERLPLRTGFRTLRPFGGRRGAA